MEKSEELVERVAGSRSGLEERKKTRSVGPCSVRWPSLLPSFVSAVTGKNERLEKTRDH